MVSKNKGINEYPTKNCKYTINLTSKGKYAIQQKLMCFSDTLVQEPNHLK